MAIIPEEYKKVDNSVLTHLQLTTKRPDFTIGKFEDFFEGEFGHMPWETFNIKLKTKSDPVHATTFPVAQSLEASEGTMPYRPRSGPHTLLESQKRKNNICLVNDFTGLDKNINRHSFPLSSILEIFQTMNKFTYWKLNWIWDIVPLLYALPLYWYLTLRQVESSSKCCKVQVCHSQDRVFLLQSLLVSRPKRWRLRQSYTYKCPSCT